MFPSDVHVVNVEYELSETPEPTVDDSSSITFKDLSCVVEKRPLIPCGDRPVKTKVIVEPFTGLFRAGEVWAVMGPSGSGKSTFLNLLARRVPQAHIRGVALLDGHEITKEESRKFGYVMQDDVLHENLTVKETLEYAVRLRRGKMHISRRWRAKIDKVVEDLGLTMCVNTKVGGFFTRGLSGGERKRVSIAIELLKDECSPLLLDEPSSGLDSSTAYNMLRTLKQLALNRRQLVIMSIHQPHSKMYKLFDKVLLLCQGKVLYMGSADGVVPYFSQLGYPLEERTNPSDHMLELASMTGEQREELYEAYENSKLRVHNETEAESQIPDVLVPAKSSRWANPAKYLYKEWARFLILLSRNFLEQAHSPITVALRVVSGIVLGALIGTFYWQVGTDQESMYDRQGALFFSAVQQSVGPLYVVLTMFQREKRIYYREHRQGLFRSFTYYCSNVVSDIPLCIANAVAYAVVAFPMVGLQNDALHWLIAMAILVLVTLCAQAMGLLISAASPNPRIADVVSPVVVSLLLLFGGLFINVANIPWYFQWIGYINYVRYGYEALAVNDLTNLVITCAPEIQEQLGGKCAISTGNEVLAQMSMLDVHIPFNMLYLILLAGGFHFAAYFALVFSQPILV